MSVVVASACSPQTSPARSTGSAFTTGFPGGSSAAPAAADTETADADPPSAVIGLRARITRIVDGDTFVASPLTGGRNVTVRVLGIDTPETKKPGTPVQCGGPEATAYAKQVLSGQIVTLVSDPTQDQLDRYGRTLAYPVLAGGDLENKNYSLMAADAGVARAYTYENKPVQFSTQIAAAVQHAQAAHRGLWGPPCYGSAAPAAATTPAKAPASSSTSGGAAAGTGAGAGLVAPASTGDAGNGGGAAAYYPNCAAARAAGVAPLHRGDPGYSAKLDRDGDGIACE